MCDSNEANARTGRESIVLLFEKYILPTAKCQGLTVVEFLRFATVLIDNSLVLRSVKFLALVAGDRRPFGVIGIV